MNNVDKKWTSYKVDIFYKNLLKKALDEINNRSAVIILGPIFILRTPEQNIEIFKKKIKVGKTRIFCF